MSQTLESNSPVTRVQLATDLAQLGLHPGLTVMVHTSLKSLGWVIGGEQTVLEALRDAVGVAGTLVMPTQSWQLCDPAFLDMTPAAWWPTIREHLSNGAALIRDGSRQWVSWEELWVEDDDFVEVVAAFIAAGGTRQTGTVGKATSQLLPIRPLVDFATKWFSTHRKH